MNDAAQLPPPPDLPLTGAPWVTIYSEANGRGIGKLFTRNALTGAVTKDGQGPRAGRVDAVQCPPAHLAQLLGDNGLRRNQAFMFGQPNGDRSGPVAPAKYADALDLTRSRSCFSWHAGPGYMFLDLDPAPWMNDLQGRSVEMAAWAMLERIVGPGLTDCAVVFSHSASSGALVAGEALPPSLHFFLPVVDARDIPRAGDVLFKRCWLEGWGHVFMAKNGALHERAIIDKAVFQPERICYGSRLAGGDHLVTLPGHVPAFRDGQYLDTAVALPDLTPSEEERYTSLVQSAKRATAGDAELQFSHWHANHHKPGDGLRRATRDTDAKPLNLFEEHAILEGKEEIRRALGRGLLPGSLVLFPHNEPAVYVRDVVANWHQYRGKRLADPIDPGCYNSDPRIAYFYDGDTPGIYSHAHGGHRWELNAELVPDPLLEDFFSKGPRHGDD